ncbi:DEKNAAC100214 [Brettanomyces naardenensis]|uniref:DEKNAAC100214 n=1 Tax=Brettanomyces naardenensis TaxID=13370 RepID=A0A448YFV6_BRENA|nr:DEKNAAC100214 [Brettanomyces naardenensis]
MSLSALPKVVDGKIKSETIAFGDSKSPYALVTVDLPVVSSEELVKPTQLLVKTQAASINPIDILAEAFTPSWGRRSSPKVMGADFAGVVLQAGSSTGYKAGDKVYGCLFDPFDSNGSFSEYLRFEPEKATFFDKIPKGMSFVQAAALPMVAGTGLQAIEAHGSLKDGNVLILGAGTSVGYFAGQFAKYYYSAKFVAGTCSSKSSERVLKAGFDKTVDYGKGKVSEINDILEIVKENGKFDLVLDCVRDPVLYGYLDSVLKPKSEGGLFAQINGSKSMNYSKVGLSDLLPQWSYVVEFIKSKLGFSKFDIRTIFVKQDKTFGSKVDKLWTGNKFQIGIDSVHDFKTDYEEAINKVASGKVRGKVVLQF